MNKILLLVIVALFSFVDINSQNIVITTQKESSVPIIDDIPIIKADTFYCCQLKNKEFARWSVLIEEIIWDAKGRRVEKKICASSQKLEKQFVLSTSIFDKDWFKMARTYDIGPARYFKGYIVSEENGQTDTLGVYVNALPPRPLLTDVTYNYPYFDYENKDIYESYYDGIIRCENCNTIFMVQTGLLWVGGDNFEEVSGWAIKPCKVDSIGKDVYHFTEDIGTNWDVGICYMAYNKYGYSQKSDTIFAKNYMPVDIVKILENAYYTGINGPRQAVKQLNLSGHILQSTSAWKQVQLFDLSGKRCYCSTDYQPSTIFPASLNGFYIIQVLYSDNKKIIKKIKL